MSVPTPTRSPSGGVAHHGAPGRAAPTPQRVPTLAGVVILGIGGVALAAAALVATLTALRDAAPDQSPGGMSNFAVGAIVLLALGAMALRWLFRPGR